MAWQKRIAIWKPAMLGPEYRRERNGGIPCSSQDQIGLRGLGILAATTYVSEKDLPERWKEENHHTSSLKILSSSCLNLTCVLLYLVPREARERKF